ncbi:hypothetical protein SCA6_006701 [Theobroma cacao]
MSSANLCLLLILLVFSFHSWILRSQELTCNLNDLIALNGFSSCLESDIVGWSNSTSDCCTWTGVTCDNSTALSKRVVSLELGSNKLSGKICDSLAGLHQLRILNLSHNLLRGSLPTKLFHMQNLEVLDLSDNDFVGRIPAESHLSSIRSLQKGIFQLQHLSVLHLHNNSFSGPLSDGIGNLSNLVELDISSNSFTGVLPDVFGKLQKLEQFSASSNKFTGILPISMVNSPSLIKLDLHNNTLNGPINLNCSVMTRLMSLHLGSNNFHGPIPHSMSSCKSLSMLHLGHNNLRGQVPYRFKNLQSLKVLILSRTNLVNLSSTLKILQYCNNLTVLILSENFREEQMPTDVNLQFRSLQVLSIAYCELRGSFPLWLCGCNVLQFLDLSRNHLSGSIPLWFNRFKYLFYVDLSNNSFTGEIPKGLTELEGLIDMNISLEGPSLGFPLFRTATDGATFGYNKIWSFPPTMDLSYNILSGPILPTFGNLRRLHVLNLNQNHLSGSIPESLVAYNELYGEIPAGGQFMTFPYSSFEGNNGLCGRIYTPCQPEHAATISRGEQMIIFGSQFAYGVVTGFLLTVTICFMSGWIVPRGAPFGVLNPRQTDTS